MRRVIELFFVVFALLLASCPLGVTQSEKKGSSEHKILVDSLVISGTRAVDSAELAEITNSIAGSVFSDDADELQERIRDLFQEHGYFKVEVKDLTIKIVDPLASPKPVRLEAEVDEGPRYRISGIVFGGYQILSADELRANYPFKVGDVFTKSKIAAGLESMRTGAGIRGLLDFAALPDVTIDSGASLRLDIRVQEGPQYHMDKLEISGSPEVAGKLQANWALAPGAIFDHTYVRKFLAENSSFLPPGFTESSGVEVWKNCSDSTVSVHLHLTQDRAASESAKHVDCAAEKKKKTE
jgi:outer membrane protein assembly factor BamA